jgi:hypothetical protein
MKGFKMVFQENPGHARGDVAAVNRETLRKQNSLPERRLFEGV